MSLEAELLDILKGNTNIVAMVSNRMRLEWLDQHSDKPAIVISRISGGRDSSLNMSDFFRRARIQVDCFAGRYEKAKELAEMVADALHGYSGAAGTYQIETLTLENEIDLGEQDGLNKTRRVALDFLIVYL